MIEAASSPELRNGLEQHLRETRSHVSRLERVFSIIGAEADTESNDVFDKMASAVKDAIDETKSENLRDAALIMCGNMVEHYEIALYGTLVAFAQQLGFPEAVPLLQQTLQEEKAADAKLTQLGESRINPIAAQERRAA
jgi:ferritin-like metal-binding protein YciE